MGRSCSVGGCKIGYYYVKGVKKAYSVYRFPKCQEQLRIWLKCLPNILPEHEVTDNMGVCGKHWRGLRDDDWKKVPGGSLRPRVPPNFWGPYDDSDAENSVSIPPSMLPTPPPKPRPTKKATVAARSGLQNKPKEATTKKESVLPDKTRDHILYSTFFEELKTRVSSHETFCYIARREDKATVFSLLSEQRLPHASATYSHSIHFHIKQVENDGVELSYEAYRGHQRVKNKGLSVICTWQQFEDVLQSVTQIPDDQENDKQLSKFEFVSQQIKVLNTPKNTTVYDRDALCQAFAWYTVSRSLYTKLREFLQLPSITTLQRLTRIAKNMEDDALFTSFFDRQEERSKSCILIVDEVYVKASLTYRGITFFFNFRFTLSQSTTL